ncbi:MAG: GrpB family protein [Chloroflexi bacterium]|nr:GrpB family protein [Chloroflexota bacterium]
MSATGSDPLRDRARARGVVLLPYDPEWPARFETAKAAILAACGNVVIALEHIGSTSVPGLGAKPYLDLMPGLRAADDAMAMIDPMAALGYEYLGEYGLPGRHYFTKWVDGDGHVWKHNVHAWTVGHAEWVRHLVFRDALRNDAGLRQAYWELKVALSRRFPDDVEAYAMAKSEFVEGVLAAHGGPSRRAHG